MSGGRIRDVLEGALASDFLEARVLEIGGTRIEHRVQPPDGETLARILHALSEHGLTALVRGRGSHDAMGNPLRSTDLVLSTLGLGGVDEFVPEEGVVRARAGTPLSALKEVIEARGWELALDPPGDPTLGGALAAAAIGPLHLGYGAPRDTVLGLDVALASGERTRCGGRVVKNVTGYDLAKLYTGSFGSLGVIEAAWLRLRPRPERRRVFAATTRHADSAADLSIEAARRGSARCACLLSAGVAGDLALSHREGWTLLLDLAGAAAEVDRDASWLAKHASTQEAPAAAIDGLRAWQGTSPASDGVRARLSLLPSAAASALPPLLEAGGELAVHAGAGLVYARFRADETGSVAARVLPAIDAAARKANAQVRLEALPIASKRERDVFGELGATFDLMRSLKLRFDPRGVLNPGRFAGRL